VATLLDEGVYVCSVSTLYRLLRRHHAVKERRRVLRHPKYKRPELLATGPNQLWSWDITKLRGPGKYTYYYLYVIIDVYSRYVVGWCVSYRESAQVAEALLLDACLQQGIERGQLTIHADRGSAMTSKAVAQLLSDLGVEKTHSRPHVSNDNPHSEAQFKTLKYRPNFPEMFGSLQDARIFCCEFFAWYNQEHRHSGIAMLTPQTVHNGKAQETIANRQSVLEAAYAANPQRFVRHAPRHESLPEAVWINAPETDRAKVAPGATLLQ
jgi:putative transposase